MRFGIFSIFDYWPRIKSVPQYFLDVLKLVERAEELGFDSFWISEHHFTNYGGILPRPQILLAAMAQRTRTIRLGTAVSLIFLSTIQCDWPRTLPWSMYYPADGSNSGLAGDSSASNMTAWEFSRTRAGRGSKKEWKLFSRPGSRNS